MLLVGSKGDAAVLLAFISKNMPLQTATNGMQDHKFFDSADWALSKQGVKTENKQDTTGLEPKLEPTAMRPRRTSHLGEDEP